MLVKLHEKPFMGPQQWKQSEMMKVTGEVLQLSVAKHFETLNTE